MMRTLARTRSNGDRVLFANATHCWLPTAEHSCGDSDTVVRAPTIITSHFVKRPWRRWLQPALIHTHTHTTRVSPQTLRATRSTAACERWELNHARHVRRRLSEHARAKAHPALPSEPIARTPYGGLVWPKSAIFRTRRIPKLRILKSQKSGSREPVFEVKSGPKNWFPIWTQKLVPDLDPKTGSNFGSKTWFPFWLSQVVPIS